MNPLAVDVSPGPSIDDNGYYSSYTHNHPSRQTSHDSYNSSDNNDSTSTKYKIVREHDIEFPSFNNAHHLGHGTYGTVVEVKYQHRKAALKILAPDVSFKAVNIEAQLLHDVDHDNIIKLYAVYKSDQQTGLLLELMPGGSLHQLLHKHQQVRYYADHALGWAFQCASALKYLHNQGFLHRDLKPSNMLLSDNFIDLKLCDFGTAAKLKTIMTNNCGSAAYMAPEVFKQSKYDQKCDMYSFGISLWEILTRKFPVDANETNNYRVLWQTTMENRRPPPCSKIPRPLKDLIERCWHQNPSERPGSEEVLRILEIIMELYGNRFKPLIDLTTNKQAFASTLHEKPVVNYSAPAHLDALGNEKNGGVSPPAITPSAPFLDAYEPQNQPRRQAPPPPPRPPMPNFDSTYGHRRGRSHDFGPSDQQNNTGYPSSSHSTFNLLPTPPPYPATPGGPYTPCTTSAQPPPPYAIGFNRQTSHVLPPPCGGPAHLAAPSPPSEIGWRRASEPPTDFGVPMGNGYVDPNVPTVNSGTESTRSKTKKKHSGIKGWFKDFAKPQ